jgi:ADP-heptose:LPS heptosyltransferase
MPGRVELLKAVDSLLGRIAVSLGGRFPLKAQSPETIRSILLIRPGGIGDAVLLIPTLQLIRKHYPEATITVLAERRNASALLLCPEVVKVLHYDHPFELFSILCFTYDVVIDTEQWHRLSAVVARLTRAPMLIGFATNERSRLFTHPIAYSQDDYETDGFFKLLSPMGIDAPEQSGRFLTVPDVAVKIIVPLLETLIGKPFVTIFPGASIPERRWGAERFRRVAQLLAAFDVSVVVVGGIEDRGQGEVIVAGGPGLNLVGRTSLTETAAIIERSALLLSGDSGVLHIAAGLGKPTVSLFGSGRINKWAPRGERHIVIKKGLPCSPCTTFGTTPPCPIGARCMQEITVDEVFNAVMMQLTAGRVVPSACCKKEWVEVARPD